MRPAPDMLAAISQLSERILCLEDCYSTCSVAWCDFHQQVEIRHPLPSCDNALHPDGESALSLAEYVLEEMARFAAMSQYNEDLPVNVGAGAP